MGGMSLTEAKAGYEKLTVSLKEIEENLKRLGVETKETLSLLPVAVLPCDTEEETKEAARYFYWHCPKITTTVIKDVLKLETSSSLCSYVGPLIQETSCEKCGNILKVKKRSRSSYGTETEVCQICLAKKKEREEQEAQWAEMVSGIGYKGFTPKTLYEKYGKAVYRQKESAIKRTQTWADGKLKKPGLLLMGDTGVGKTTLALWAICRYSKRTDRTLVLIKYPDFDTQETHNQKNLNQATECDPIYIAQRAKILMIDNLGHMSFHFGKEAHPDKQEIVLRILDYRIQYELPTIIVTSLTEARLKAQFNEAIVGRLMELCNWVEMDGKNLREREICTDYIVENQTQWNQPQTEAQHQALAATNRNRFRTQSEHKKMLSIEKLLTGGDLPTGFWENRLWSAKHHCWSLPKLLKYTLDENNLKRWEAKQKESAKKVVEHPNDVMEAPNKSMPYDEYLQTEHWQNTRTLALQRANYKCQLCNDNDTLNVHHKTYARLWKEQEDDLVVLCQECHERHHDKVKA